LNAAADKRPNIVFIFSDDHSPNAIGAYNRWLKSVNPTPNIDKLAAQGMVFERSYCTNSICGPVRAVIETGKHSHLNGFRQNGDKFNWDQQTFPKLLQASGYQTVLYGKYHMEGKPQGYDDWVVLPGQVLLGGQHPDGGVVEYLAHGFPQAEGQTRASVLERPHQVRFTVGHAAGQALQAQGRGEGRLQIPVRHPCQGRRAANTSRGEPRSARSRRTRARIRSMAASLRRGSWWVSTSRVPPQP
jgi:arylsulfatase A-like enzyme